MNKWVCGYECDVRFVYLVYFFYSVASELHPNCTRNRKGDSDGNRDGAVVTVMVAVIVWDYSSLL